MSPPRLRLQLFGLKMPGLEVGDGPGRASGCRGAEWGQRRVFSLRGSLPRLAFLKQASLSQLVTAKERQSAAQRLWARTPAGTSPSCAGGSPEQGAALTGSKMKTGPAAEQRPPVRRSQPGCSAATWGASPDLLPPTPAPGVAAQHPLWVAQPALSKHPCDHQPQPFASSSLTAPSFGGGGKEGETGVLCLQNLLPAVKAKPGPRVPFVPQPSGRQG